MNSFAAEGFRTVWQEKGEVSMRECIKGYMERNFLSRELKRGISAFLLLSMLGVCFGCEKQDRQEEKVSLEDVRQEARDFSFQGKNFTLSKEQIHIPDTEVVSELSFHVDNDDPDIIEKRFVGNLKKLMQVSEVDKSKVKYYIKNLNKEEGYDIAPITEASDEMRRNNNGYLIYFDGTYQEVLNKTSMLCELGCNKIPKQYLGDKEFFDSPWVHIGLEIGEPEKVYRIPQDETGNVSYPLSDGEYKLSDAIRYVEKHIKEDYAFVGSKLLDYSVYQADVRKLKDGVYFYQFRVRAEYQGVGLNKDMADYENKNIMYDEGHIVSMFAKDDIGYIWSCPHSYTKIDSENKVPELISIRQACETAESKLTNSRAFEIDSMELLYLTEFVDNEDQVSVKAVKCYPVYHFKVANPALAGYRALYFEVNAKTGEFLTGINQAQ